ncbi:hypothetical protein SETIT_6G171600v2 [Setaria italica]|uniref:Uncharacterized protein n=1 Tax=Setaria italica TaxID=4555 RepID=A0A368RMN8_SETIT|nr:hypothetical protein SETIT_6G171600v2 [Setaria italica]
MDVPFFVAFSAILLVGRYLPFALPANARAALADDGTAAPPARAAKCAISVAVAGLVLLVSVQCGSSAGSGGGHGHQPQPRQCPAVEARALWLKLRRAVPRHAPPRCRIRGAAPARAADRRGRRRPPDQGHRDHRDHRVRARPLHHSSRSRRSNESLMLNDGSSIRLIAYSVTL